MIILLKKNDITDSEAKNVLAGYAVINRLIDKKDPYNKTIQHLQYDNNNCQIKSWNQAWDTDQSTLIEYQYDKNNRLITTLEHLSDSPDGTVGAITHISSQTYDNVGNIPTKMDTFDLKGLCRVRYIKIRSSQTINFSLPTKPSDSLEYSFHKLSIKSATVNIRTN